LYASDVVISRDERLGQDEWHKRAVDAYYLHTGALLGTMRAEISTLLQLAPRANYEAFLRLYNDEVLALDSCLLELMKIEATPTAGSQPARCVRSEGKHAGATWDTLAESIVNQDLEESLDREFESLAEAFRLQDRLADGSQESTPSP
jgi:hypothetical protein